MTDTDQLNHVSPVRVTKAGINVVDALSDYPKAVQLQVLASLNLLVCEQLNRDPRQELERAGRLLRDGDGQFRPEVGALRAYIDGELT